MKKLLLGTLALVAGIAAPAAAADMGVRPLARPAAYTNWSGCFVGGEGGNLWGHSNGYSTTASSVRLTGAGIPALVAAGAPLTNGFDMTGFTGGGYGGCQVQFGVWVLGAEGSFLVNNKEGQAFYVNGPSTAFLPLAGGGTSTVPAGAYWSAKERWVATARAKLGYAIDKWLFSVSGGAAWMKIDTAESVTVFGFPAPNSSSPLIASNLQTDYRIGWTVGGAVEYALPYNWSIRTEYLYVQIPSYTTLTPGTYPTSVHLPNNISAGRLNNHILLSGLAYKFF